MRPTRLAGTVALCAFAMVVFVAAPASAEWYVNPFFGKMADINWADSTATGPKVFGVSAGTNPQKRGIGFEVDYTHSKEFFGPEDQIGSNQLRTFTAGVLYGVPIAFKGVTRLRPYGAAGGGFGHADLGSELVIDEDYFFNLTGPQFDQLAKCLGPNLENPTNDQIAACGVPLVEDERGSGYLGTLHFGGGVLGFIAPHIGASADFRYFRRVPSEDGTQSWWRFAFGVVIH